MDARDTRLQNKWDSANEFPFLFFFVKLSEFLQWSFTNKDAVQAFLRFIAGFYGSVGF